MPTSKHAHDAEDRRLEDVTRELYSRNAELAVRNKMLSLLRKLDEVAMSSLDTGQVAQNIGQILATDMEFQVVGLVIVDARRKRLVWRAISCASDAEFCHITDHTKPIPLSSSNLCARVVRGKRALSSRAFTDIFVPSFSEKEVREHQRGNKLRSVLAVPLVSDAECIGVLVVGLNRGTRDLTKFEKETIEGLTNLITIAVQKAQIYTSLRATTEQLAAANKKLKELDALKTEFLSIASHQLRTPLAVIKGYADMFESDMLGKMTKAQKDSVHKISTGTQQLIALVNHLLDISRIETGRLVVRSEPIDASKLSHEILDFLRPRAEQKGLEVRSKIGPNLVVMGDSEKLKEVVINLVDNAIKYTPKGHVLLTLEPVDSRVHFAIRDTGYGLTEADQRHLFEKFSRGSASKQVETSTGLGLYVCRKLVEAMGGTVWAESAGSGSGSVFHVVLPGGAPLSTPAKKRKKA